jgi:hypothetical protein
LAVINRMKGSIIYPNIPEGFLKGKALTKGWSLCIGAGTSLPIFPSWEKLVINLIKKDKKLKSQSSIDEILSSFSLDALIQAASNLLDLSEDEFVELLSNELYSNIKNNITPKEWVSICKIFTSINANATKDPDWINFINVREKIFNTTSANGLARIIIDAYNQKIEPTAILSFNAEPLLYALINSYEREPFIGKVKREKEVREIIDLITVSISSKCKGRIPYYFCHGALLNQLSTKNDVRLKSTSKLVFSESNYLELANSNYAWQSINFLNTCSDSTVIFIGVSLTDPNMRKWLTWIQNERNYDIEVEAKGTQHFWINTLPKSEDTMRWMEAAVLHLGIRIIWINTWSETEDVVRKIIGIKTTANIVYKQ